MTTDAAPDTAAEQPPEAPPEPSGPPSEAPAQTPEVTNPAEVIRQAVSEIPVEGKRVLWDNMTDEERQEVAGGWLERNTQSRAAKNESDAELKLHALDDQGRYYQDLEAAKAQVKDVEDLPGFAEKVSDLGAVLANRLDDRYTENALRRHPVHQALTPEDEQKLTSARAEPDRLIRRRNQIEVYLNRAMAMGQAPAAVRQQVEAELGMAEKLTKLAEAFKGAAGAPPSPEAATGGSDQDRLDRLAAGTATDADKKWYQARYGKYAG